MGILQPNIRHSRRVFLESRPNLRTEFPERFTVFPMT